MAKPETGALTARESAGKDSRGIRHRLGVFLRRDAIRLARVLRERRGLLLVLVPGVVAGLLMIVSEFLLTHYITVGGASCTTAAPASVRDSCAVDGFSGHHGAIAIVGLFTIIMAVGATLGRSRPAAIAMLAAGAVCLGIALIADLPDTNSTGSISPLYSQAAAHAGAGFWLELIGALLAIGAAAMALAWPAALVPGVVEEDAEEAPEVPKADVAEAEPEAEAEEPEAEAEVEPVRDVATKETEPEPAEAEAVEAEMAEEAAPKRRSRGRRARERGRKTKPEAQPADVGIDEGSEGEAVEPETEEAASVGEATEEEAAPVEAVSTEAQPETEPATEEAGAPADDEDTWDVEVHDTPAARRAAERRAKRRERAEAARKRQQRPPRERDRKKRPD